MDKGTSSQLIHTLGLQKSVQELTLSLESQYGVSCEIAWEDAFSHLESNLSLHIYRVLQEAVRAALEHRGAKSLSIVFSAQDHRLEMAVQDDGTTYIEGTVSKTKVAIRVMKMWAEMVKSHLDFLPMAPGGTRVVLSLPRPEPRPLVRPCPEGIDFVKAYVDRFKGNYAITVLADPS